MWFATVLKEKERERVREGNNRNCKTCVYLIEVDGFKDMNTFYALMTVLLVNLSPYIMSRELVKYKIKSTA